MECGCGGTYVYVKSLTVQICPSCGKVLDINTNAGPGEISCNPSVRYPFRVLEEEARSKIASYLKDKDSAANLDLLRKVYVPYTFLYADVSTQASAV